MKSTRKLIPALVMLLVSAIMLSTASYAWFASNSTVTAENMQVKVKSNSRFLQISTNSSADFGTVADFSSVALKEIELVTSEFSKPDDGDVTLGWFTGESSGLDEVGGEGTTPVASDEVLKSTYVLYNRVYVKMSDNSTDKLSNLVLDTTLEKAPKVTVKGSETAPTDKLAEALRILIVARGEDDAITGACLWDYDGTVKYLNAETGTLENSGSILATVELTETYTLDIYVYYDGEDANAYTDNTTDADGNSTLQELSIDFAFTASTGS